MKLLVRLDNIRNIFGLSFLMAFMLLGISETIAQGQGTFTRPVLPKLSLMGEDESYNKDFYPDGRIWVPPTVTGAREFLVPVFVTNNWFSYKNAQGVALYRVEPITSFEFSLFYNDKAVRAIGVESVHPSFIDTGKDPLAKNFTIKTDDFEDDYYWYYISPNKWTDTKDKEDGRRIRITAVSNQGLAETDPISITYEVLLYVRFRVIAQIGGGSNFNLVQTTPMYIDNRVVKYNDMNVATDYAWAHMIDYDTTNYQNLYSRAKIGTNRGRLDGDLFLPETFLDGLNNAPVSEDENSITLPGPLVDDAMFNTEPVYPGVITLKITDNIPKIRIATIADDEYAKSEDESLYELDQIVTVDDNSPEQFGVARIKITNSTSKSRLQNVSIETDSEWLRVFKDVLNENKGLTIKNNGRDAFIKWIDNGILGDVLDPVLATTNDDGDVLLEIRCDPTRLPKVAGEIPHGIHIGYITLKSDYAEVSPVRIKVTFVFLRNPYEPDWTKAIGNPGGINILMTNRVGEQSRLVFGTGDRATEGVDNLYGEFAWGQPMATNRLDARWYPTNKLYENAVPFGFGDFAPNNLAPRTSSRDIRPYDMPDSVNSWTYNCKFNNATTNYPITLEWDVRDFPKDAQLFLRTVINGSAGQAINMANATPINETRRSFTITDTRINEYLIEYTLPQSLIFVDNDGNPLIKTGWNLLSLPLSPENKNWDVIYPNAINVPWAFVNSQYQERRILNFGEGYFVKYPNNKVDTKFVGAFIKEITTAQEIKVFGGDTPDPGEPQYKGGWNLVGGISVVTGIEGIKFQKSAGGSLPELAYTKRYGVYGYKTDLGYYQVGNIVPGMGYWIKVSDDGYYGLEATYGKSTITSNEKDNLINNSQALVIRDNSQRESRLYMTNIDSPEVNYFEYPPAPMAGLYDIRFSDNKYLTNNNSAVIKLQGVTYPIALNLSNSDADYTFTDAVTGKVLGTINAGKSGVIVINELPFNAIKVNKTEVSNPLDATFGIYPNPTKDFSTISFSLTENSFVTVELFDAIGNKVNTVVEGNFVAGNFTQSVDLTNYSTGNYIAKITAGKFSSVVKFSVVK